MSAFDTAELISSGLLQEVNRKFFHPLGLALATLRWEQDGVGWDELYVRDYRDDPEGVRFDFDNSVGGIPAAVEKARNVNRMQGIAGKTRVPALGYFVQPLPGLGSEIPEPRPGKANKGTATEYIEELRAQVAELLKWAHEGATFVATCSSPYNWEEARQADQFLDRINSGEFGGEPA